MAPLEIDIFSGNGWKNAGEIKPGEKPGSLTNYVNGRKDVYVLSCAPDDSTSVIHRITDVLDHKLKNGTRRILNTSDQKVVDTLNSGESHELILKTSPEGKIRKFRFSHKSSK